MDFEVLHRDGFARVGRFSTPHGVVETPALLPVIHPDRSHQVIPPSEVGPEFGLGAVITSAYITWRSAPLRERALAKGIHDLLGFHGPVFTDSGAFQQHAYGHVEVTPEEILRFQDGVGSDIATVLDVFVEPGSSWDEAQRGTQLTLDRGRSARASRTGLLAVPVQGGSYPDLRRESAAGASSIGDVLAIGGVVPLLESYRFADLARCLRAARSGLAPERAVHLFGTGHPLTFAFAALFGVDLFDSAAYHKFARRGALLFPEGTVPIDAVREPFCSCRMCAQRPLPEVAALAGPERETWIARHNLLISAMEVRRVRQSIRDGTLWELVERRAAAHPALSAGLRAALTVPSAFFAVEPESRPSFRVTSETSVLRPSVERFRSRVSQWKRSRGPFHLLPRISLRSSSLRTVPAQADGVPLFWEIPSALGPVPLELSELYPAGCAIGPEEFDAEARPAGGGSDPPRAPGRQSPPDSNDVDWTPAWTRRQIEALFEWLYASPEANGPGDHAPFRGEGLDGARSRHTGRLRELRFEGRPAFRLGNDGIPRPTWIGAQFLHRRLPAPRARVQVLADSVEPVAEGRSLFSRFAARLDPELVPGSSALLVDPSDRLLAVGRLLLAPHEFGRFRRGVAAFVTAHARAPEAAHEAGAVTGTAE
jgi:7-cyano-7-deazaguanine tRNA-ribosyltransferase